MEKILKNNTSPKKKTVTFHPYESNYSGVWSNSKKSSEISVGLSYGRSKQMSEYSKGISKNSKSSGGGVSIGSNLSKGGSMISRGNYAAKAMR